MQSPFGAFQLLCSKGGALFAADVTEFLKVLTTLDASPFIPSPFGASYLLRSTPGAKIMSNAILAVDLIEAYAIRELGLTPQGPAKISTNEAVYACKGIKSNKRKRK